MAVGDDVQIVESREMIDGKMCTVRRTINTKVERVAAPKTTTKTVVVEVPAAAPEVIPVKVAEPVPADDGNVVVEETEQYINGVKHVTRRIVRTMTTTTAPKAVEAPPPKPVVVVAPPPKPVVVVAPPPPAPVVQQEVVPDDDVRVEETEEYIDGVKHVTRRIIRSSKTTTTTTNKVVVEAPPPVPEPEPEPEPLPVVQQEAVPDDDVVVEETEEYINGVKHVTRRIVRTSKTTTTTKVAAVEPPPPAPEPEIVYVPEPVVQQEVVPDDDDVVVEETEEYINGVKHVTRRIVRTSKTTSTTKVAAVEVPPPEPVVEPEIVYVPEPVVQQEVVPDDDDVRVEETEEYIDGVKHVTRRIIRTSKTTTTTSNKVARVEVPPPKPVVVVAPPKPVVVVAPPKPVVVVAPPEPVVEAPPPAPEPEPRLAVPGNVLIEESEEYINGVRHVTRRISRTNIEVIPPEPAVVVAPPKPVVVVAPPKPVVVVAPPKPVVVVAPPEPVVVVAPPEPIVEAPEPEPLLAVPGDVVIEESEQYINGVRHITRRVSRTTIEVVPPEPVVVVEPPKPVVVVAPPEPVVVVAPPEPVVVVAPPEPVIVVAPPEPVIVVAPPELVVESPPPEPEPEPEIVSSPEPVPVVQQHALTVDDGNVVVEEKEEYIDGVRHTIRKISRTTTTTTTTTEKSVSADEVPPLEPIIAVPEPEPVIAVPEPEPVIAVPEPEPVIDASPPSPIVIESEVIVITEAETMALPEEIPEPVMESEQFCESSPDQVSHLDEDITFENVTLTESEQTSEYITLSETTTTTEHVDAPTFKTAFIGTVPEPYVPLEHDKVSTPEPEIPEPVPDTKLVPTCRCVGPSGDIKESLLKDNDDGTYTADITASEPGVHTVNVEYDGNVVPGSPFIVRIKQAPDTKKIRMYGAGLESGLLENFQDLFHVDTTGAGPGDLKVRVHGPKNNFKVHMSRNEPSDRVININYVPSDVGVYTVNVYWSGEHVAGSPNELYIAENEEQLSKWYHDHDIVREEEGLDD